VTAALGALFAVGIALFARTLLRASTRVDNALTGLRHRPPPQPLTPTDWDHLDQWDVEYSDWLLAGRPQDGTS
jgi:hypothetical protein